MSKDAFYSMIYENKPLKVKSISLSELSEKFFSPGVAGIETAGNMHSNISSRVKKAVKASDERRNRIRTLEDLNEYQKTIKKIFLDGIGGIPKTNAPLNVQNIGTADYGSFVLEKIIFESRPKVYVTCNVYRNTKLQSSPRPAILLTEGHYTEGKAAEEYQNVAQTLAHAGFLVLIMDPFAQGERFEHYESEVDYQSCLGASTEHNLMDSKMKCAGISLARYFAHDGIRAIEYLRSRPDVDPNRIAVTGNSGGGTQTYLLAAAASDLIAAIAPCSFNCDMTAIVENCGDLDNEQWWPHVLGEGVDYPDILAMMAPKPILLLCNKYDFFPREGAERTLEKVTRLWDRIGSAAVPKIVMSKTGHEYCPSLAKAAGEFFAENFNMPKPDYSDYVFRPLARKDLNCTHSGIVIKDYPDAKTMQSELDDHYREKRKAFLQTNSEISRDSALSWLRKAVMADRRDISPNTRVIDDGGCLNYIYRQIAWNAEEHYWGAGLLLRDARFGSKPLPIVIALWNDGLRAIKTHSHLIHKLCTEGKEVLIADLAASGFLSLNRAAGREIDVGWSTKYAFNGLLVSLGDSIAATRAYQASRIPAAIADLYESDLPEISYYGEGEFSRYAKMAALLNNMKVNADSNYQPWGEIVTDKYADLTNYMDWLFPGAAIYADMDDIDLLLRKNGLMKQEESV